MNKMNKKHLIWIIPLCIIIGLIIGLIIGFISGMESTIQLVRDSGACEICKLI